MTMEPALLDHERRRFFDENGYLVVRGALTPEEVAELTAAADRMIDDFERPPGQAYAQRRPGIVEEPAFHPLLAHSATVPLVVQLLSPQPAPAHAAIIYKWPEGEARRRRVDVVPGHRHDRGRRARGGVPRRHQGRLLPDRLSRAEVGLTLFAPGSHRLPTPLPIPKGAVDPDGAVDLFPEVPREPRARSVRRLLGSGEVRRRRAQRGDGHYLMYINGHIIGRSKDLLHWESTPLETRWPGREGCFALADYSNDLEDIGSPGCRSGFKSSSRLTHHRVCSPARDFSGIVVGRRA